MFRYNTILLKERRKYHYLEIKLWIFRWSFYWCRGKFCYRKEISNWDSKPKEKR